MWEYTDKVKEYFLEPKNVGSIDDANAVGEVGSLACGDALKLFLKIEDGVITDAKFQTFGCASAIASSSALTELLKGKTIDEAQKITNKDIADFLGGLPKEKMHCSVMGQEALEAAIKNYYGEKVEKVELEGELVCHCFGVTDELIRRAIRENDLKTVEDVTNFTKAGGGCGDCVPRIQELLDEVRGQAHTEAPAEKKPLTNIQRMQLVMQVIDEEIRPSLRKDKGDIELVDITGTVVQVALRGACTNCPASQLTLTDFVQKTLRELVDPDIVVKEVSA
ncbi:NifU-like protein [Desulfobaculum xiamenense]|uniref:Nitrogen fixation protein NifU n=1 Tax=Desulfobaculum xiamenense TaxID=995050 RepID=A0A846QRE8_9BACT|nr:Fe-S cluster assembly protein NifU [Desulfobaculum xiamenense]NJB68943.1 NifU-like protein [Desulfobaculum xiamenense]